MAVQRRTTAPALAPVVAPEPAQVAVSPLGGSRNIQWAMEGDNTLILIIDVSPETLKNAPLGASGKNPVPASTLGWEYVPLNGKQLGFSINMIAKGPR